MNEKDKKNIRLNSIRGTQRFTKPSQTNDSANIKINAEIAIHKLEKLAEGKNICTRNFTYGKTFFTQVFKTRTTMI